MKSIFMRMRITPRLALVFGIVLLVNFAGIGLGIWRLDRLQAVADELGGTAAERALLAQELHAIVVISAERAQTLMRVDDAAYAAAIGADRKATSARSEVVRKRLDATWGLGETGAAGPTGNRYGDAAGHTCIALAGPSAHAITLETGDADRIGNMRAFARRALELLAEALG